MQQDARAGSQAEPLHGGCVFERPFDGLRKLLNQEKASPYIESSCCGSTTGTCLFDRLVAADRLPFILVAFVESKRHVDDSATLVNLVYRQGPMVFARHGAMPLPPSPHGVAQTEHLRVGEAMCASGHLLERGKVMLLASKESAQHIVAVRLGQLPDRDKAAPSSRARKDMCSHMLMRHLPIGLLNARIHVFQLFRCANDPKTGGCRALDKIDQERSKRPEHMSGRPRAVCRASSIGVSHQQVLRKA